MVRVLRWVVRECCVVRRVVCVRVMVVMVDWASVTSVASRWDSGGGEGRGLAVDTVYEKGGNIRSCTSLSFPL